MRHCLCGRWRHQAFTILELLVAMTIVALIAVMLLQMISHTSHAVRVSTDRLDSFKTAREAFDELQLELSQATLNSYYDYYAVTNGSYQPRGTNTTFTPAAYGRLSDLHFVSGRDLVPGAWDPAGHAAFFQIRNGLTANTNYSAYASALNACGFFVAYQNEADLPTPAGTVTPRKKFVLYRMIQPTEKLDVLKTTSGGLWFSNALASTNVLDRRAQGIQPFAENVFALVILPKASPADKTSAIASNFSYDSRTNWPSGLTNQPAQMHQLPPLLDVAMITVDDDSSSRVFKGMDNLAAVQSALKINFANLFTDSSQLDIDLKTVEDALLEKKITCRIFRATIPLRNSKWSQ